MNIEESSNFGCGFDRREFCGRLGLEVFIKWRLGRSRRYIRFLLSTNRNVGAHSPAGVAAATEALRVLSATISK